MFKVLKTENRGLMEYTDYQQTINKQPIIKKQHQPPICKHSLPAKYEHQNYT